MKEIASYGLAVIGVGIIVGAIVRALATSINYASGKLMLINLLRTNPNHAHQVCANMQGNFYEAVASALATGAMMRSREATLISPATIASYDATTKGVLGKMKQLMSGAKMAVMAAGAAVAIQVADDKYPVLIILLAIVCGGGWLFLYWRNHELERTLVLARREVLPEVDQVFITGRYVLPPLPEG